MSKDKFKMFVRANPNLVNKVNSGSVSWQQLYEVYDIYGENNSIWETYFRNDDAITTSNTVVNQSTSTNTNSTTKTTVGDTSIKDLFNIVKKMDLESVRKGVDGLQKAVGLLQEFAPSTKAASTAYQARPLYQHLQD